jgi:hypothetical protein
MLRNISRISNLLPSRRAFSTTALCVLALLAALAVYREPTSATKSANMRVVPVPVRSDNYACKNSTAKASNELLAETLL